MKKNLIAAPVSVVLAGLTAWAAGTPEKGKDVFEQNCAVCHNADSTDTKIGPGLKGLFKKAALVNKKKVTEESVIEFINMGSSEKGMPSFADLLSDQEKADLIAYLKTL